MVRPGFAALVFVATLTVFVDRGVAASDLPRRAGMYPAQGPALAMVDSDVAIRLRGAIAEATVTQTFRNDSERPTEATYIFPLPPDAAVSAMEIVVGNRTLRAAIEPREQAKQRYEQAVAAGVGAGLLEHERPDVFTQTVSAIPAKGTVRVTLRFDTVARYQGGTWELALPLVVAPRYVPGTASGRPTTGMGRTPDTDRAPDASRVTPPAAPGAGGATTVELAFESLVDDVSSSTHEVSATRTGYRFTDPKSDHDAIIRWRAKAQAGAWIEAADGDGGFAAILLESKPAGVAARRTPLRVALVVDHAATVRGDAEAVQRPFIRALLGALDRKDSVALASGDTLVFGTSAAAQKTLDERPRTVAPFDLTSVLSSMRSDTPIVLVTDGLIADDRAALAAAAKLKAPLFVVGVGPAPNRGLLQQLAQTTAGTVRFASVGDELTAIARDVLADVAAPPERVSITWGTLSVSELVPENLPRIGAGQSLLVVGRVKKFGAANARVRGDLIGFVQMSASKQPAGATTANGPLARRWAKIRLDELVAAGNAKAITEHAIRFGLVSPTTSMVAIGHEIVVEGGVKHTVAIPVSVPAGMKWQLVKQQTTVDTRVTTTTADPSAQRDQLANKKTDDRQTSPTTGKPTGPTAGKSSERPVRQAPRTPVDKTRTTGTGGSAKPTPGATTSTPPRMPIAAGPQRDHRPVSGPTAGASQTPAPAPVQPAPAEEPAAGGERLTDADDRGSDESVGESTRVALTPANDGNEDAADTELVMSSYGGRNALRLWVSLGAGVAIANGDAAALGSLALRLDYGLGTRVGIAGSVWLVDGLHGQGSIGPSVTRVLTRHLVLGAGGGVRFTADAVGPAIDIGARVPLPRQRFSAYLRYDGALLRNDSSSTGQHAGSFGLEARW